MLLVEGEKAASDRMPNSLEECTIGIVHTWAVGGHIKYTPP